MEVGNSGGDGISGTGRELAGTPQMAVMVENGGNGGGAEPPPQPEACGGSDGGPQGGGGEGGGHLLQVDPNAMTEEEQVYPFTFYTSYGVGVRSLRLCLFLFIYT
jgi:hypothetical protein